jgi:hypothetical protein
LQNLFQFAADIACGSDPGSEKQRKTFPVHQGRVNVRIDQTRHNGLPLQVHHLCAGWLGNNATFDRSYAFAADDNRNSVSGLIGETVDQPGVFE